MQPLKFAMEGSLKQAIPSLTFGLDCTFYISSLITTSLRTQTIVVLHTQHPTSKQQIKEKAFRWTALRSLQETQVRFSPPPPTEWTVSPASVNILIKRMNEQQDLPFPMRSLAQNAHDEHYGLRSETSLYFPNDTLSPSFSREIHMGKTETTPLKGTVFERRHGRPFFFRSKPFLSLNLCTFSHPHKKIIILIFVYQSLKTSANLLILSDYCTT